MNYTTIYFKIENQNCEEKGYVEIYDDDEYMPEFYYWNNTGYQCQEFVEHKREKITGLTDEQISQIEQFKVLVNNTYVDWILEFIFMADEDEVDELKLGDILTVKVGEEF